MEKRHDLDRVTVDMHQNHLVSRHRCQKSQKDLDLAYNLVYKITKENYVLYMTKA